jgi:hypothetical protein
MLEEFADAEASKALVDQQKKLLCGDEEPLEEIDIGYRCKSKYGEIPITWCEDIRFVPNGERDACNSCRRVTDAVKMRARRHLS